MLTCFPPHGRRVRVFHLEPVARPAACIARAAPLADNALAPELARVLEYDRAGVIVDPVEHERERMATGQEPGQLALRVSMGSSRRSRPLMCKRSKAQRIAGSSRLRHRRSWKSASPLPLEAITSPSIVHVRTASASTAAKIAGKPIAPIETAAEISRTRSPLRWASMR